MPEFVNYQLQQTPIRQIDTNLVGKTLDTITAGNRVALQKQSELKAAIANMDLNEAEDEFRQQLYNDINNTVEQNTLAGNAYYALDDIIKKAGDIDANPALLGRLRAQQEYKKFNAEIDARRLNGDINQDTADWAKAQNPYSYEDKYKTDAKGNKVLDSNGNPIVIGGSEWKPTITPVKDIDFNDVFDAVAKELKPISNSWSSTKAFLYSNGEQGNVFKPGETVGVLNEASNTHVELTEDRIKQAIKNAFQNNPQLAAQAKQSWDVLIWKAKNGKIKPQDENNEYNGAGGIFNNSGSTKSYDQYIRDMVDGYAKYHTYYSKSSTIKYYDSAIARQYDIKTKQGKYKDEQRGTDVVAEFGNPAKNGYFEVTAKDYLDDYNNSSVQLYQYTQSLLKNSLTKLGIETKDDITSIDQIKTLIGDRELSIEQQQIYNNIVDFATNTFEKYRGDFEAVQAINSKGGSPASGYNEVLNTLESGRSLDTINTNNPAAKEAIQEYSKIVDRAFGVDNMVGFRFKSKDALDKFINSQGGEDKLTTIGYKISGNNIYIDKDHSHLLYDLSLDVENYNGDYWRANEVPTNTNYDITGSLMWNVARRASGSRDNYVTVNEPEIWTRTGFDNMFRGFGADLDKKITDSNTTILEQQKADRLYLPQYRISSWSSFDDAIAQYSDNVEEILGVKRKKEFDSAAQQAYIDVKNGEHQDEPIRVFNNEGRAIIVDGATKKEILEELQAVEDNAGRGFGAIIDGLGARYGAEYRVKKNITQKEIDRLRQQGAQIITTGEKDDKDKIPCVVKREIILDYYENDNLLTSYNELPTVINSTRPVGKYFANSNYYYGGSKGMEYGAKPYKTDDINYQWRLTIGGADTDRLLTNKQVGTFETIHHEIIDKRIAVKQALAKLNDKSKTNEIVTYHAIDLANDFIENYKDVDKLFNTTDELINYIKSVLGY